MMKKYFDEYQSQEDEDYNPTKKQQALYRQQHEQKKKLTTRTSTVNDLWQELKEQHLNNLKKIKPNEQEQKVDSIDLAHKIMNNTSLKPDKRIIFAGKQFIMNEQTGQLQIAQKLKTLNPTQLSLLQLLKQDPQQVEHKKTKLAYQYLNHIMKTIYNRSRRINSIGKSQLDWKGFVNQEGIEHKLNYNRKGGVIKDMQFMKNGMK